MNLTGKRILVTGGAVRVGREICRTLAAAGAQLLIHCRQSTQPAAELAETLPGSGHQVLVADLSCPADVTRLVQEAGIFDALVNNASRYQPDFTGTESSASRRLHFEVNFFAPLQLMDALIAQHRKESAIVNVLDQQILHAAPQGGAYAWSRRTLASATLEYAQLYAAQNCRVNAVAPGPMLPPPFLPDSKMTKTLATVPLGRKVEPRDLAQAVKFLLENDSITGAILPVDGGQHLGMPPTPGLRAK